MAPAWWAALVALIAALYVGIDLEELSPMEDGDFDFSLLPAEVQVNYFPSGCLSALVCLVRRSITDETLNPPQLYLCAQEWSRRGHYETVFGHRVFAVHLPYRGPRVDDVAALPTFLLVHGTVRHRSPLDMQTDIQCSFIIFRERV